MSGASESLVARLRDAAAFYRPFGGPKEAATMAEAIAALEAAGREVREADVEAEFWCCLYGEAMNALDECAGDDEEGWDRQAHAEACAEALRKKQRAPLPPVAGWREIASAPKDGTPVLLWRNGEVHAAKWTFDCMEKGRKCWGGIKGNWWFSRSCEQPTHWMPFPTPPVGE